MSLRIITGIASAPLPRSRSAIAHCFTKFGKRAFPPSEPPGDQSKTRPVRQSRPTNPTGSLWDLRQLTVSRRKRSLPDRGSPTGICDPPLGKMWKTIAITSRAARRAYSRVQTSLAGACYPIKYRHYEAYEAFEETLLVLTGVAQSVHKP